MDTKEDNNLFEYVLTVILDRIRFLKTFNWFNSSNNGMVS